MENCCHNKNPRICKDCDGRDLCKHGKQKHVCIRCKGASVCRHKRIRNTCKKCLGTSFCEHKRLRTSCRDCKGSARCVAHNRIRSTCKDCSPLNWAKRLLWAANKKAKIKGYKPPNISPEELLLLRARSKHCEGCGDPLLMDGYPVPHLHHHHDTGEVVGFVHASCNHIEGHLRKLPLCARRLILRTFFPEVFS